MANVSKFVDRMRYWCVKVSLGYDQYERWNIYPGGECDCSSLVIFALKEAGFKTGTATYTGNLSAQLVKNGWVRLRPDGNPKTGDILLNDSNHVAVYVGSGMLAQASIDERGNIHGGKTGDQTVRETNVSPYYNYPWNCYLRYNGAQTSYGLPNNEGWSKTWIKSQQLLLIKLKYKVEATGILDSKTRAATATFQKKYGLVPDGIPGEATNKKLAAAVKAASKKTEQGKSKIPNCKTLQAAVRAKQDNAWGNDTDKRCNAVIAASNYGGVRFPNGIRYTQRVVGTDDDGYWKSASRKAHDATVINMQKALKAMGFDPGNIDGVWDSKCQTAYIKARNVCHI